MKIRFLTILFCVAEVIAAARPDLSKGFLQPPPSSHPWVFWFWMNGNVTSNGITADLEAMRRAGIRGALLMEVDYATPQGPVAFGSPPWRALFRHACAEAARLGMEIRMNNDAGYCGSGGPWITPELSMQKLVWTEITVASPADLADPLPQPEIVAGFYRDIAVLAYPAPTEEINRMADLHPVFSTSPGVVDFDPASLQDGDTNTTAALPQPRPGSPSFIGIEFARQFTARQLVLKMPVAGDQTLHGSLEASEDGQTFRLVREFDVIPATQVFNFPEVTARHFRILFARRNPDVERFVFSEIELSPRLRIEGVEAKALFTRKNSYPGPSEFPGRARYDEPRPGLALKRSSLVDLTRHLDANGKLTWNPPPGNWMILRLGHTSTGKQNHPAPPAGLGLECDKLSRAGAEAAFRGLIDRLADDTQPWVGKSFKSMHIDSWEVGSQNWTAQLPAEFRRRRGYDLLPFLPAMTGRVVDTMEISERFLWDLRQTVSELAAENYAGHMHTLAKSRGLTLSIEAYDGPNDDLTYGGRADEPMAEFWTWPAFEMTYTCTEMASAAHVYGKNIVGAEAFTAMDAEKWLAHPYAIKAFGDWAFCEGINRMVIHRYAMQPWTAPTRLPGMAFGPFGVHFERTQTWWDQSRSWNLYLARCQFLLQQGRAVADICYLAPQMSPRRWRPPGSSGQKDGYSFDGCPDEVLFTRMSVKAGRLVLPDGMSYRVLALQETETMTPELLARLRELALAGATIVGAPPIKSPSLSGYPECDVRVRKLVQEIWGDCDGQTVTERRLGKGRIIWGPSPQQVLARDGLPPDFHAHTGLGSGHFNYVHRSLPGAEVYFVANKSLSTQEAICAFRTPFSRPELWWPDTGRVELPGAYQTGPDNWTDVGELAAPSSKSRSPATTLRLPLRLGPAGSVFVIFPHGAKPQPERIVEVANENRQVLATGMKPTAPAPTPALADGSNSFTIAFWAKPAGGTSLPEQAVFGKANFFKPRNDVIFPLHGHFRYRSPDHAGVGISVGTNGVWVIEHSADYWGSPLVYAAELTNWKHFALVYEHAKPRLYLDGKRVHEGIQSTCVVHCSLDTPQRRASAPFIGALGPLFHEHRAFTDAEVTQLMTAMPMPVSPPDCPVLEVSFRSKRTVEAEVWRPGRYVAETSSGRQWEFEAALPSPIEITGPWQVSFAKGWGAPEEISFERLISWSEHPDLGIRHFSGTATYSRTIQVPQSWLAPDRRVHLDLGDVAVMADLALNGKLVGTLWKPPFRIEVSDWLKPGPNQIEIKVVNLWINRMIGDESLPEDSARLPQGSLSGWPEWLQAGQPSPTGRFTFTTYRLWPKGAPLQTSGLLGPVRLIPTARVVLDPKARKRQ